MTEAKAAGQVGVALLELVAVMDRLRRECPWDARQTHGSLAPHLIEETYEALEAIEQHDLTALREELGDVLLQVFFHARVAAERTDGTAWTIDDVAEGITAKLVRRHPHVFGDVSVSGADEVKRNWDQIKRAEREARDGTASSVLDGVPMGQPALWLAVQLLRRAGAAGAPAELANLPGAGDLAGLADRAGLADLPGAGDLAGLADLPGAGKPEQPVGPGVVSALGAELFAVAAKALELGLDPELELRHAARIYRDRVRAWEQAGG